MSRTPPPLPNRYQASPSSCGCSRREYGCSGSLSPLICTPHSCECTLLVPPPPPTPAKQVSGKPIKFVGVGEKMDALEPFYPERMAQRILGMGDMLTLYEKAQEAIKVCVCCRFFGGGGCKGWGLVLRLRVSETRHRRR